MREYMETMPAQALEERLGELEAMLAPCGSAQVARAEEFMRSRGFRQVRVRHHGEIARLEVGPEELERAFEERDEISAELLDAGFLYVTLDLAGYKPGSLNAALKKPGKKTLPVVR